MSSSWGTNHNGAGSGHRAPRSRRAPRMSVELAVWVAAIGGIIAAGYVPGILP